MTKTSMQVAPLVAFFESVSEKKTEKSLSLVSFLSRRQIHDFLILTLWLRSVPTKLVSSRRSPSLHRSVKGCHLCSS